MTELERMSIDEVETANRWLDAVAVADAAASEKARHR
jgi:hypothetical protein